MNERQTEWVCRRGCTGHHQLGKCGPRPRVVAVKVAACSAVIAALAFAGSAPFRGN